MQKGAPFIETFQTPNGFYFYDVNRNEIKAVSEIVYVFLKEKKTLDEATGQVKTELDELVSCGYLSDFHADRLEHGLSQYLEHFFTRRLEKITLQVTQSCNFRCSYCIYSGIPGSMQRAHSQKRMSWEMAKKGIDFLWHNSIDSKTVDVAFYGGEPLLAFGLVKKCMEYAKTRFAGKQLTFSMTTNGSLLTLEIARYFAANNVILSLSIDGDKQTHDANRVYAATGAGTFDDVRKNLEAIREYLPEYFDKITYNMVIDPTVPHIVIGLEGKYGGLFAKGARLSFTDVDHILTPLQDELNARVNGYTRYQYHQFLAYLASIKRFSDEKVANIARVTNEQAGNELGKITPAVKLNECDAPAGPCIPGQKRLFMNTDGNFYPCERVSEGSGGVNCIGHIDTGFDIAKAYKILNICQINEDACRECTAFRICGMCVKFCTDDKGFSAKQKALRCKAIKDDFIFKLRLTALQQEMPKAYNQYVP